VKIEEQFGEDLLYQISLLQLSTQNGRPSRSLQAHWKTFVSELEAVAEAPGAPCVRRGRGGGLLALRDPFASTPPWKRVTNRESTEDRERSPMFTCRTPILVLPGPGSSSEAQKSSGRRRAE
jgi:hypothetical protein